MTRGKIMKYCPKCGAQLPEGVKFCPKCGAKLPETQSTTANTNEVNHQSEPLNGNTDLKQPVGNQVNASNNQHQMPRNGNIQNPNGMPQNMPNFNQAGVVEKKSHLNLILGIILGVVVILGISFAAFTRTSSYRDLTTSDDQKLDKAVHWSNNFDDVALDVDISLNGKQIRLSPREDGDIYNYLEEYTYDANYSDNSRIKSFMKQLSKKATKEWGSSYTVMLMNPENSKRYLVKASNGSIKDNYLN